MGHIIVSILLGIIGGVITYALGYDNPWPFVIAGIVFLAYWGVFILVIDGDGF